MYILQSWKLTEYINNLYLINEYNDLNTVPVPSGAKIGSFFSNTIYPC